MVMQTKSLAEEYGFAARQGQVRKRTGLPNPGPNREELERRTVPERINSPVSLLASFLSQAESASELVLVTGDSGAGKTAWCQDFCRQARAAGLAPLGVLSPAVFESGEKTGIDLLAIHTGERRRLAIRRDENGGKPPDAPATSSWTFDPLVLAWGNRLLGKLPDGDLLVLDELGPLEFTKNTGLTAGLALIDSRRSRLNCVVVRPALLHIASARWPWARTLDVGGWLPEPGGRRP